jgi:zinc transport system substrate-binding protein
MMLRNIAKSAIGAGVVVAMTVATLSGCGSDRTNSSTQGAVNSEDQAEKRAAGEKRPTVYASFYPIEEALRAVGGEDFTVVSLTPVGVSPHEIELRPETLEGLEKASAVFFLGRGFQPSVEKAIGALPASVQRVDLLSKANMRLVDPAVAGVEGEVDGEVLVGNTDPHVWVDPVRFSEMVGEITDMLKVLEPKNAAAITARSVAYRATIDALDGAFRSGLSSCASTAIVTSHRAFGYLANRYGLEQLPIAGISPEAEPNPKSIEAVANLAKAKDVTVIFFESLVPKKLSETVASEIGATTSALDPIEGLTAEAAAAGSNYVSIQQDNLSALRAGLRCR